MSYVIVNLKTGERYCNRTDYNYSSYPALPGANIVCGKLQKQALKGEVWAVMTQEEFRDQFDPMVESRNLLNGKPVMIRKSELGGCTDPGTETYWSM